MSRVIVTSWPGFFSRLANVRLLDAAREVRGMRKPAEVLEARCGVGA
jgi:hypothetical protein